MDAFKRGMAARTIGALFFLIVATVLIFATMANAASVTLAWDPNSETIDGYKIFHRIDGGIYDYVNPAWTGEETTGMVYNLADDATHYFVVRAYRGTLESADSIEVSFTPTSYTPINGVAGVIIKTIVIPIQ